jgi:hypothetical protein
MPRGTGALRSPPDDRDLVVSAAQLERLAGATILPASYIVPSRPPITDQGPSPMCVAYSSAYEQNEQDQREHGRFYDFNESSFFWSIGGTINGAVMRYALDRMLAYGYPEQDSTPSPAKHKISGYFRIDQTDVSAMKRAIIEFGGILVLGQWFASWEFPVGNAAILPSPSGSVSGHAYWVIGWDDQGRAIAQQTWGSSWGDNGLFRIGWSYITRYGWEAWKTADDLTLQKVAKARIRDTGITIRNWRVKREAYDLRPNSAWGRTRDNGIRRLSDGKVVVEPWSKALRFGGFVRGAKHGIAPYPRGWAKLSINGVWRYVARPLVRMVSA